MAAAADPGDLRMTIPELEPGPPTRRSHGHTRPEFAAWRNQLLRALIEGDVAAIRRAVAASETPYVTSSVFTLDMAPWEMEYVTPQWWSFLEATPLHVAAAFSRTRAVEWLLRHGADRHVRNELRLTALDVAGDHATGDKGMGSATAKVVQLLKDPAALPSAPRAVSCVAKAVSEEKAVKRAIRVPDPLADGYRTVERVEYVVVDSLTLNVSWGEPPSNGAIIQHYRVSWAEVEAEGKEQVAHAGGRPEWRSVTVLPSRTRTGYTRLPDLRPDYVILITVAAENEVGFGPESEVLRVVHSGSSAPESFALEVSPEDLLEDDLLVEDDDDSSVGGRSSFRSDGSRNSFRSDGPLRSSFRTSPKGSPRGVMGRGAAPSGARRVTQLQA